LVYFLEEFNNALGESLNIIVSRDEFGEQKIMKIKDAQMTYDMVEKIHGMSANEIKSFSTRDKFIWFRYQVD